MIGNVPFADVKLDYRGQKLSLHDFFIAKSVDALKPGGVLALVTSHYTLDKQNAAIREYLAEQGRFPRGDPPALRRLQARRHGGRHRHRVPAQARPRPGAAATPTRTGWKPRRSPSTAPRSRSTAISCNHPEMVLGNWSRKDTLYGGERLQRHRQRRPGRRSSTPPIRPAARSATAVQSAAERPNPPPAFIPPPPERHITEGSFFVGDDRIIHQIEDGQAVPVTYGGTLLKADGTMTGKRLAALVGLRDHARRVLQSQNEGWPEAHRDDARRDLNRAYDRFVAAYGPINKTTFTETADGTRHPPHAQPGEIPRRPGRHAGHGAGGLRRGDRQGGQGRRSC